jgi:hypothetical protein
MIGISDGTAKKYAPSIRNSYAVVILRNKVKGSVTQ